MLPCMLNDCQSGHVQRHDRNATYDQLACFLFRAEYSDVRWQDSLSPSGPISAITFRDDDFMCSSAGLVIFDTLAVPYWTLLVGVVSSAEAYSASASVAIRTHPSIALISSSLSQSMPVSGISSSLVSENLLQSTSFHMSGPLCLVQLPI